MKSIHTKAKGKAKYSIWLFFTLFAILMGLFYIGTILPLFKENLFPAYLRFMAEMSSVILNWLGQDITVKEASIYSSVFAIDIKRGCDAIEASALFACAILAFPAPFLLKLPGIVIGILFLFLLNLIRIIGLFFIGIYYPQAFEIMHIEVGQALFILLALLFFVLWLTWVTQRQRVQQYASD
jgi:exosortase family protein XrtM